MAVATVTLASPWETERKRERDSSKERKQSLVTADNCDATAGTGTAVSIFLTSPRELKIETSDEIMRCVYKLTATET